MISEISVIYNNILTAQPYRLLYTLHRLGRYRDTEMSYQNTPSAYKLAELSLIASFPLIHFLTRPLSVAFFSSC